MYFIVGLIILIALWAMIEQNLLMTTKFDIAVPKTAKGFAGASVIVLSDLHGHSFGIANKRLLIKIDRLKPDFIFVTGDMINKDQKCIPSHGFLLLEKLAEKYKIYYSLGNHEQYIRNNAPAEWVDYKTRLEACGVVFLDNNSVNLAKDGSKLKLTGLSIGQEYYFKGKKSVTMEKAYLNNLLGRKNLQDFQVLLAHNPLYFQEYAAWGSDLTIAGHMHGGLVRLPFIGGLLSPQVRFFPKYDSGRYEKDGRKMIVSRGMGSHSVMFRLFNPPELVLIRFQR